MAPTSNNPAVALNEVLSEMIDVVQEVKQARRKVSEPHPLHAALDHLFDDLLAWSELLVEQDDALGLSPLESMPSVAGRKPPNLWPGATTDEEVRRLIDEHLDRLGRHVTAALAKQGDCGPRDVLASIERGVHGHREKLGEPD